MKSLDNIGPCFSRSNLVYKRRAYIQNLGEIFAPQVTGTNQGDIGFRQFRFSLAPIVLRGCGGFHMGWINASSLMAKMVEMFSKRNGANLSLVDESMGNVILAMDVDLSIPSFFCSGPSSSQISSPNMAGGSVSHITNFKLMEPIIRSERAPHMASSKKRWLSAAAEAQRHIHQRVTSLVGVARRGLAEWVSTGSSFYLDATLREVT